MNNLLPNIESNLETNLKDEVEEKAQKCNRKYEHSIHGIIECWIPRCTELIYSRFAKPLRNSHQQMNAFKNLFKGKRCRIPCESLQIIVAGSITGYGCSDEAAIVMLGCTFRLLVQVMGIDDISNEMIACALPSHATLATSEHKLATDCIIVARKYIKDDGATKIGIMPDHGHRSGQDHLIKIASWSGFDWRMRCKMIKTA